MAHVLPKVGLFGLTAASIALTNVVTVVLVSVGWVLVPVDVGCQSFPYSGPCSLRRPSIMPSCSSVAPRSWRLLLVMCILRRLPLVL